MAELAFFRRGEELLRVPLSDRTAVGRGPECDVLLPDPAVSRVQAVVERRGDGFHLVDRSGRGTRVDGAEVAEVALADGAEIALGAWRALFRAAPPGEAEPTRAGGETEIRRPGAAGTPQPARLRVRERGRERLLSLEAAGLTVGSDASNGLTLDDPFVSARHLRLEPRGAGWQVTDLGSTNGTFLSGVRVMQAELPPGLPLSVGDCQLALEVGPPRQGRPSVFEGLFSSEPSMRQVFDLVERVAATEVPVTILGETGTGKELVARAIHLSSHRRDRPFVALNCAGLTDSLLGSQLFGHTRGAFTGAIADHKGLFEAANGGTLFLDEIGDIPLNVQTSLLRVLQEREIVRLGECKPRKIDVRVLAATHHNLSDEAAKGTFRADLLYRIRVARIELPPLCERREDIPLLVASFLGQGSVQEVSADAVRFLLAYPWPGNVRELKSAITFATIRCKGSVIEPVHLPAEIVSPAPLHAAVGNNGGDERPRILAALAVAKGNRPAAARLLGISRATLYRRLANLGISSPTGLQ